jgi:hypothetical protein
MQYKKRYALEVISLKLKTMINAKTRLTPRATQGNFKVWKFAMIGEDKAAVRPPATAGVKLELGVIISGKFGMV